MTWHEALGWTAAVAGYGLVSYAFTAAVRRVLMRWCRRRRWARAVGVVRERSGRLQ